MIRGISSKIIQSPCHGIATQQKRTFLSYESRSNAIQSFFQHLESNYGNLPSLMDTGPAAETIVSDDGILHPDHLARLFQHQATALHVPNFFHPESAKRLGEELIQESLRGGGSNNWKVSTSRGLESSDVATLGEHSPYNIAVAREQSNVKKDSSAVNEYFEGVQREFRSRRRRQHSSTNDKDGSDHYQLWPLDKLRLELEEAWPSGAGLARETKPKESDNNQPYSYPRPFGGGLPRIMRGPTRWKRGFIHVDEMGPLDDKRGLFSANIYLTMPESDENKEKEETMASNSGALYVWPLGVRSRVDWYRNAMTLSSLSSADPEMQLNLQHVLGKPNIIRPKSGDLVLICAQRPHCAVGFGQGVRVSLQCFLQYNGPKNRLLIDC